MNVIASALGVFMLIVSIKLSKILKEKLTLRVVGKTEFNNLDVDLITRCLIFFGLIGIQIGIVALVTNWF